MPAAAIAHDVVGGHVAVDDLTRERRRDRGEIGSRATGRREAQFAPLLRQVADELLDDGERVAELPLEIAVGSRLGKRGERGVDLGGQLPELLRVRAVDRRDVRQRRPVDDLERRDVGDRGAVAGDLGGPRARRRRDHTRCQDAGLPQAIGCREVQRDCLRRHRGVEDLQQHARARGIPHEEVAVLLAAELVQLSVHPVRAPRESARLVEVDLGPGQQPCVGHARQHRARGLS